MVRLISFGDFFAVLCNGDHRAMLSVSEPTLPAQLADYIDKAGGVSVTEIFRRHDAFCIRMVHDFSSAGILGLVCEAISEVYDTDTSVALSNQDFKAFDTIGMCMEVSENV